MSALHYADDMLLAMLRDCRTIAMAGASPNWVRPSYFAMKYLQGKGYRVIPVNPRAAGERILGEACYASLSDIPDRFDMVDVFRRSDAVPALVDETIALKEAKGIKAIWLQLGVIHDEAAAKAEAAGLQVVMDRCVKIEYGRLSGELSWGGINSGIITSRRRRLIA